MTTETYDALGRLTAVWPPPETTGPANYIFPDSVSATAPSVATTNTKEPAGNDPL